MIIVNCLVEKIEKENPRYPDPTSVSFSDVYRCECTMDDGSQFEASFLLTPAVGEMTRERTCDMLMLFARAVSKIGMAEAA